MAADEPPYLTVGTDVSAKYKGAFCEAKIKKVNRVVKCKVTFKNNLGCLMLPDDQIRGSLRIGAEVEARHPEKNQFLDAVINKMQDYSQYTVVFDDGDETTLRRTSLCLKSGRHFAESPTLDQFPLTNPEHFGTPVIGTAKAKRKRRSTLNSAQLDYYSSDEEVPPKKTKPARSKEKDPDIGKVVCVDFGDRRKKDNWYPALIVAATAAQDGVKANAKDEFLVKSFKDGKICPVAKKDTREFNRDSGRRVESNTLKIAVEKAMLYFEKSELPPNWDKALCLGLELASADEESQDTDSDTSDDEPSEEKDRFVAQLYKFMDERGTPINKAPSVGSRDVNLYKLFKVVHKMGGYNRVTNQNKWKIVYSKMGLPSSNVSGSNQIKLAYKRYLHSFEDFYRKLGCTMVTNSRSTRGRHRSDRNIIVTRNRDRDTASPKSRTSKDKSVEKKPEDKSSDSEKKDVKAKSDSTTKSKIETNAKAKTENNTQKPKVENNTKVKSETVVRGKVEGSPKPDKFKRKVDKPKTDEKEDKDKLKKEDPKVRPVRSQSANKDKRDSSELRKETRTVAARARIDLKKEKVEGQDKRKEKTESLDRKKDKSDSPEKKKDKADSQEKKKDKVETQDKKKVESPEKKKEKFENIEKKKENLEKKKENLEKKREKSESLEKKKESPEKKNSESPEKKKESPEKKNSESPEKKKATRSSAKFEMEKEKREKELSEKKPSSEIKDQVSKDRASKEKKEEKATKEIVEEKCAKRVEPLQKDRKLDKNGKEKSKDEKGKAQDEEKSLKDKKDVKKEKDELSERKAKQPDMRGKKPEDSVQKENSVSDENDSKSSNRDKKQKFELTLKRIKVEKGVKPKNEKSNIKVEKEEETMIDGKSSKKIETTKESHCEKDMKPTVLIGELRNIKLENSDSERGASGSQNLDDTDEDLHKQDAKKKVTGSEKEEKCTIDVTDSDEDDGASSSDKEKEIEIGDRVRVKYGRGRTQKVYEAKVLKSEIHAGEKRYFVHYAGWNTRYDEWVKRNFIVENISDKNRTARQKKHIFIAKNSSLPQVVMKKSDKIRLSGLSSPVKLSRKNSTSSTTSVSSSRTTRSDRNSLQSSPFTKGLQPKQRTRKKSGFSGLTDTSQESGSDDEDDSLTYPDEDYDEECERSTPVQENTKDTKELMFSDDDDDDVDKESFEAFEKHMSSFEEELSADTNDRSGENQGMKFELAKMSSKSQDKGNTSNMPLSNLMYIKLDELKVHVSSTNLTSFLPQVKGSESDLPSKDYKFKPTNSSSPIIPDRASGAAAASKMELTIPPASYGMQRSKPKSDILQNSDKPFVKNTVGALDSSRGSSQLHFPTSERVGSAVTSVDGVRMGPGENGDVDKKKSVCGLIESKFTDVKENSPVVLKKSGEQKTQLLISHMSSGEKTAQVLDRQKDQAILSTSPVQDENFKCDASKTKERKTIKTPVSETTRAFNIKQNLKLEPIKETFASHSPTNLSLNSKRNSADTSKTFTEKLCFGDGLPVPKVLKSDISNNSWLPSTIKQESVNERKQFTELKTPQKCLNEQKNTQDSVSRSASDLGAFSANIAADIKCRNENTPGYVSQGEHVLNMQDTSGKTAGTSRSAPVTERIASEKSPSEGKVKGLDAKASTSFTSLFTHSENFKNANVKNEVSSFSTVSSSLESFPQVAQSSKEEEKPAESTIVNPAKVPMATNISSSELKDAGLHTSVIAFAGPSVPVSSAAQPVSSLATNNEEQKEPHFMQRQIFSDQSIFTKGKQSASTEKGGRNFEKSGLFEICHALDQKERNETRAGASSQSKVERDIDQSIHESMTELTINNKATRMGSILLESKTENSGSSLSTASNNTNVFLKVESEKADKDAKEKIFPTQAGSSASILPLKDTKSKFQSTEDIAELEADSEGKKSDQSEKTSSNENGGESDGFSVPVTKKGEKKKKCKMSKQDKKSVSADGFEKEVKYKPKKKKLDFDDDFSKFKDHEQRKTKKPKKNKNKKHALKYEGQSNEMLSKGDLTDEEGKEMTEKVKKKKKREEKKFTKFDALKSDETNDNAESFKKEKKKGRKNKIGIDKKSELGEKKIKKKKKVLPAETVDSDSEKDSSVCLGEKRKRKERKKMKLKDNIFSGDAMGAKLPREENPDISFLLCEEKVPASPVNNLPDDTTGSSSMEDSNRSNRSPASIEEGLHPVNIGIYSRSGNMGMLDVVNKHKPEACAVLDNTPPTTPSSTESIPSSSPSHDREPFLHYAESTQSGRDSPGDGESDSFHCDSTRTVSESEEYRAATTLAFAVCKSVSGKAGDSSRSPTKRQKGENDDYSPTKKKKRSKRLYGIEESRPGYPRVKGFSPRYSRSESYDTFDSSGTSPFAVRSPSRGSTSYYTSFSHASSQQICGASDSPNGSSNKSSKINFYIPLAEHKDPEKRISILQEKMAELRKLYTSLKAEVATIDRRRKKARKKIKEAAASSANTSSTTCVEEGQDCS